MVLVIYTVRVFLFVAYRPKVVFTDGSVKSSRLKTPSVLIANHTSMWDPLMMLAIFFHKMNESYDHGVEMAKRRMDDLKAFLDIWVKLSLQNKCSMRDLQKCKFCGCVALKFFEKRQFDFLSKK